MNKMKKLAVGVLAGCVLSTAVYADDDDRGGFKKSFTYLVTITNLTNRTFVSKAAVTTHKRGFKVFELGQPNGALGLEILAETGLPQTLVDELISSGNVLEAKQLSSGLDGATEPTMLPGSTASAPNGGLQAGESFSIEIQGDYEHSNVSVFAMIAPSNDAFVAVNSVKVPLNGKAVTIFSPVYDSGDEANTEFCYDETIGTDGGLSTPTIGGNYQYREGGPTNFPIDPASNEEDEPNYIPVPFGAREGVCRFVNHSVHPEQGGDPTGLRIPPSGNPPAQLNQSGEGKVLIHRGIQGVGQLNPSMFDWRNPGAKITIKRIR